MSVNLNNLEPRLNKAAFQILAQWWIDKKIDSQELKVIGRWAMDYPKTMEALDASELHTLALPQAEMELEILQSKEAKDKLAQGLTEMEIMLEAEIDLEFYLIKAPKLSNPKFHQALEEDLRNEEEMEDELTDLWRNTSVLQAQEKTIKRVSQVLEEQMREELKIEESMEEHDKLWDKIFLKIDPLDKNLSEIAETLTSEKALNKEIAKYHQKVKEIIIQETGVIPYEE